LTWNIKLKFIFMASMNTYNPSILAIATAVPPCSFEQEEAANKMVDIFQLEAEQGEKLKKLYRNSAIHKRHSIIDDFKKPRSEWNFWGSHYPHTIPSTAQRNAIYKREAPKLAHQAAQKAIQKWGGSPQTITHVISVSCTGLVAPGLEFHLIESLGLNRSIARLGINFMGCFGAFKGLAVAQAFAKENPAHRVLVVCTELCSLHLQTHSSTDAMISNALFCDGAAAAIVGSHPEPAEKVWWQVTKSASLGMNDSLNEMSWEIGDHGFDMRLLPSVPQLIGEQIAAFASSLIDTIPPETCDWAIHPGGKAILHTIEKKMQLHKSQTCASWETLRDYGNMSSATFLFVLEALYRQRSSYPWTIGLGFGPGLSVEGILLKKPQDGDL
jgi:predicted naringenin-chalcone synthase